MSEFVQHHPKVFNDPIHGHMEFPRLCIAIIDTPQFQRLRYIKQLGGGYFVFPGASHNRFEHSLGVGYLAGELARKLKKELEEDKVPKEELDITDKDILCLEIAGLCHDLGHGPFSHTFDDRFLPLHKKLIKKEPSSGSVSDLDTKQETWKHEDGSADMFEYMIRANGLKDAFSTELSDENEFLIKALIYGDIERVKIRSDEDKNLKETLKTKLKKKNFLFEIVANKKSGVDVDKWDYFARDCHHLGIPNNFDHNRLMHFAKVVKVPEDGCYHIAFRDKQVNEIYDMFYIRNSLHRRALQHKNKVIWEYMVSEALHYGNDYLLFTGKDGQCNQKLSETVKDMVAYSQVNDSVYHRILDSKEENEDMDKAREILNNIEKRKLYPCVGQSKKKRHEKVSAGWFDRISASEVAKEKIEGFGINKDDLAVLMKELDSHDNKDSDLNEDETEEKLSDFMMEKGFAREDFIIVFPTYDYGKGHADPVQHVLFYDKNGKLVKFDPGEVTKMIPEVFFEKYVRLYSRKRETVDQMFECFKQFCSENGFYEPKNGDPSTQELSQN